MDYSRIDEFHVIAWACWGYVCVLNLLRYRWNYRRAVARRKKGRKHAERSVVIWSPVKGYSTGYEDHLNRLLNQDYADYEIIISIESREDPVFNYLQERLGLKETIEGLKFESREYPVRVIIAGQAVDQGQKVQNLIAAYEHDEGRGEVIITVDADAHWEPHVVQTLVAGLEARKAGISMGYRWIVPERPTLPNLFASMINASVGCLLGPYWHNSAWAGTMAIRRTTLEKLEVIKEWKGKANDESVLMNLLTKNGLRAVFCPEVTPVTPVDFDWKSAINFGRRQYIHQWVYRRILWFYGASFVSLYLIGWAKCLYLMSEGSRLAMGCAVGLFFSDMLRGILRQRIIREILPKAVQGQLKRTRGWELFGTPIWFGFHLLIVWSTLFCNRFNWSGVRYIMRSKGTTVIRPA